MIERATVTTRGKTQSVQLPESCQFSGEPQEVLVRREGRRIILEPADAWPEEFLATLGAWEQDIPRPIGTKIGDLKTRVES